MEASCDFEEDLCNFYQDKEGPGWTRVKVKPNMYRAGDHTSGIGKLGVCGHREPGVGVLQLPILLHTHQDGNLNKKGQL